MFDTPVESGYAYRGRAATVATFSSVCVAVKPTSLAIESKTGGI